uniref:RNase H type-1 domain-containing protein n=1 Tax=Rhizophagus irregularis (strain DAOM 181602 / DAOM 197198 / MUCL 43194) TaxID=747089 RepID=U9TR44_RHIID
MVPSRILALPTVLAYSRRYSSHPLIVELIYIQILPTVSPLLIHKNLLVTLFKVPGHSNNLYNDEADTLAKAGAHIREPIIINHKFFAHQSLGFASWNRLHVIDRNVRKWADNVIQPLIFNSMINNKALIPIKKQILDGEIDWTFTREWLNYNNSDAPCSINLSKYHGNKIKKSAYDLYDIIIENSTGTSFALRETIESSPLFNITFPGALSQTHPDKKLRFSIFIKFFTILMQKIDTHIWAKRSSLIKCWEHDTINNDVPRRSYTHRRITATPYFREGGFYDNHAHIRWTSSNFLHSAHWTVYRDCLGFNQIDLFSFINNSYIGNVLDIR